MYRIIKNNNIYRGHISICPYSHPQSHVTMLTYTFIHIRDWLNERFGFGLVPCAIYHHHHRCVHSCSECVRSDEWKSLSPKLTFICVIKVWCVEMILNESLTEERSPLSRSRVFKRVTILQDTQIHMTNPGTGFSSSTHSSSRSPGTCSGGRFWIQERFLLESVRKTPRLAERSSISTRSWTHSQCECLAWVPRLLHHLSARGSRWFGESETVVHIPNLNNTCDRLKT